MAERFDGVALLAERVRLVYQQIPILLFGALSLATIATVVLWETVPHGILLPWLGLIYLLSFVRLVMVRHFNTRKLSDDEVLPWRYQTIASSMLAGLLFGGGAGVFVPYCDPYQLVFIAILVVGTVGGGLVAQAPYPPAYAAYAIPAILPFGVMLMFRDEPSLAWTSPMVIIYLIAQLGHARFISNMVGDSIRLRFEKADLVNRLREENQRAEQAVVAKSRFLASASHDLRQPLHALGLFVEAQGSEAMSERARELRSRMNCSLDALTEMINGLLDVSRLEAGAIEVETSAFPLTPLLYRLHNEMMPGAKEKGLRFEIRAGDHVVVSDPLILERILRNLLDNAIKYTQSGTVAVFTRLRAGKVMVEVRDSGVGMAKDDLKHIFDEYFQLDNPGRDASKGLGLGLAIVKGLAQKLGVEVKVNSSMEKGTIFRLSLPAESANKIVEVNEKTKVTIEDLSVVLIDDNELIRESLRDVMHGWGCRVMVYGSEQDCVRDQERAWVPDVLLVDYRLQGVETGEVVAAKLKAFFGERPKVYIVTGETSAEPLRCIKQAGFAVLHKPLQAARLRASLASAATYTRSDSGI